MNDPEGVGVLGVVILVMIVVFCAAIGLNIANGGDPFSHLHARAPRS